MKNSNQPLSSVDLRDNIHAKLEKSKAVLTCIMFATEYVRNDMALDNHTLYHALWAVDDYLEDLDVLFKQLENLSRLL